MRRVVSAILGINTIVISGRKHNLARNDKNLQFVHIQLTEEINYNDYNMVVKYRMPNGNVLADILEIETDEFDIQIPNEVVQLSGELAIEFTLSGKENDDSLTSLGRIKLIIQDTLESNIDQEEIRVLPTVANVLSRITERTKDGITEIEKASEEKINDINSFLQKQKEQLADEVSDYSQNLTNQKDSHLQDLDTKLSQSKDALDAHEKSNEQKIDAFVKSKTNEYVDCAINKINDTKNAVEEHIKTYDFRNNNNVEIVNYYNKNDITTGFYLDGSEPSSNSSYFYTGLIPAKANDIIYLEKFGEVKGGSCYDINGEYVCSLRREKYSVIDGGQRKGYYSVPDNEDVAYVKINGFTMYIDVFTIYINSDYDGYIPFGYKEKIPNIKFEEIQKELDIIHKTQMNTNNVALYGKKLVATGDSICAGAGYRGGYAKIIGERNNMKVQNIGVGGGTLTAEQYVSSGGKRFWICREVDKMDDDADFVLLEGGVNDASLSVELGEITDDYRTKLDDTTFCGAMESLCKQVIKKFQFGKIGFIIVHRMSTNYAGIYRDKQIEILKKWGIPYLDLQSECPPLNFIPELKEKYTLNGDGWHPNHEGYKRYYCDKIESFLKRL